MELVVDANVVISGIITLAGKTSDLLFSEELTLFSPEFLKGEFEKYKPEILIKSGLTEVEFDLAISLVFSQIIFIPFSDFRKFIKMAGESCPDPNDTEYFALALKLGCSVWSDDKTLKRQDIVKVISTSELLKLLEEGSDH